MLLCSSCGADNQSDSKFCKSCGTPIGQSETPLHRADILPPKDFSQEMAEAGKRFGKDIAAWWDTTLGILSPVMMGFFGVVFVLFCLILTDIIASESGVPQFWEELSDFIAVNFPLLVGLMSIGAFHACFYRRYRSPYKRIGPVVSATLLMAWTWVLARVLILAGENSEHPVFRDAGRSLETVLPAILVLGILVGYAFLRFSLVSPANWDKPEGKQ